MAQARGLLNQSASPVTASGSVEPDSKFIMGSVAAMRLMQWLPPKYKHIPGPKGNSFIRYLECRLTNAML